MFLDWLKAYIFGAGQESSICLLFITGLTLEYRLKYCLNIQ